MERAARGDISKDEMRKLAKEKMGGKFDEMEFEKGVLEMKERMSRKDAVSYENKGYGQRYDPGPSYEGYDKEHMIFGMVFEQIGDDIDPRDIKQHCNEPEKIADIVISKLREKIGDFQNLCAKFDEQGSKCADYAKKGCSQMGTPMVRQDATEIEKINSVAYSCPANPDAIKEACKKRGMAYVGQRMENAEHSCRVRFDFEGERLLKQCEQFRESNICDKEKYLNRCMGGMKKEDFEEKNVCPAYPTHKCGEGAELQTKTDANGCNYYYCEAIHQCPTPIEPQCISGQTLQKKVDDKNCVSYYCQAASICPESAPVTCASGQTLQKKADNQGCVSYYCETVATTQTGSRPAKITQEGNDGTWCYDSDGNGGYFSKGYCQDNSGSYNDFCDADTVRDYYCTGTWNGAAWSKVRCEHGGYVCSSGNYKCSDGACISNPTTTTCPEVSKPACAEGQSMTVKYDDQKCIIGYECVSITANTSTSITGQAVLSTYDNLLRQCGNSWMQQQKTCTNKPSTCDKDTFIQKCREQEERNNADFKSRIEQNCETQTTAEIKYAEQKCLRIDEDRKRCLEESGKRCSQMMGLAEKCKETLTEENLRKFIVDEAKKSCKFTDIMSNEDDVKKTNKAEIVLAVLNTATESDIEKLKLFVDELKEDLKLQDTIVYKGMIDPNRFGDIKLLPFVVNAKLSAAASSERAKDVKAKIVAGQKAEEAAGKLASLRDSGVPKEYLYIIEDKASDVLNVSNNLEEIQKKDEQKGIGYKIKLFLGMAKQTEKEEINKLGESKDKLQKSVEVLTKLADEVPSDVAKSILKEQVESLKKQQEDIEVLIETKEKKAKGLLGLFG